jgi:hypothetical protein
MQNKRMQDMRHMIIMGIYMCFCMKIVEWWEFLKYKRGEKRGKQKMVKKAR